MNFYSLVVGLSTTPISISLADWTNDFQFCPQIQLCLGLRIETKNWDTLIELRNCRRRFSPGSCFTCFHLFTRAGFQRFKAIVTFCYGHIRTVTAFPWTAHFSSFCVSSAHAPTWGVFSIVTVPASATPVGTDPAELFWNTFVQRVSQKLMKELLHFGPGMVRL